MAARTREIRHQVARGPREGLAPDDGVWSSTVLAADPPPTRAAGRVITAPAADAAREIADFLADRRII